MKRAYWFTAAIIVASLGGATILNACARDASPAAARPLDKWTPGLNYTQLPSPQPTNVKPGKVEVLEVFWYGCGHCYALDPTLEEWKKTKPAYVDFVRVPVMWGPPHEQHARLYYTLMELNRLDLHSKVFDAIHKDHVLMMAQSDAEARAQQLAFCKSQGISEQAFNAAYDSPAVAANLQRAKEATFRYGVSGVPLIIVNGKYTTDVAMAGSDNPKLVAIINDLAASEKKP
jgi:thiol:disulfide interchange protein DsbA